MRTGGMRHRLTPLKPVRTTNAYGEETTVWEEQPAIHAERVKLSGRRVEVVAEHFPDYSAQYNIRAVHDVEENWRVKEHGGHLYEITNITPNIERGYKTLFCERVNE